MPRWNLCKAVWPEYTIYAENNINQIEPISDIFGRFINLIKSAAKKAYQDIIDIIIPLVGQMNKKNYYKILKGMEMRSMPVNSLPYLTRYRGNYSYRLWMK